MSDEGVASLAKARQLLSGAQGPSSSTSSRREFFKQLISLCSYPSYECKAFFGTLVAKYFAEFEDLQDKAINAILDLCEDDDEKIRAIGIKGLGATAKVEKGWARGNFGVLLQLLECPPKELRLVHEQISNILPLSPVDCFEVMSFDCCGSEAETGASRRNILDFLTRDATALLRPILESGDHLDAEKAFQKGFEEVLKTTAIPETRQVLSLLVPLSTVSGKNAPPESAAKFSRLVTDSLHSRSSPLLTQPLIKIYADFVSRTTKLDARVGLRFWAAHGVAILQLALEKADKPSIVMIDKLRVWSTAAVKAYNSTTEDSGGDISERELTPAICEVITKGLAAYMKTSPTISDTQEVWSYLEVLLFSLYQLISVKDRRRDLIRQNESNILLWLSRQASDLAHRKTDDSRRLENVTAYAETLVDYSQEISEIVPSWKPLPEPIEPPAEDSLNHRAFTVASSSRIPSREMPTGPAQSRVPVSSLPPSISTAQSSRGVELLPGPSAPTVTSAPPPAESSSAASRRRLPDGPLGSHYLSSTPANGSTARASTPLPIHAESSRTVSAPVASVSTPTRTLVDRLGPQPAKRSLETESDLASGDKPTNGSQRSLLSRMGSTDGETPPKRMRESPVEISSSKSLLNRMTSASQEPSIPKPDWMANPKLRTASSSGQSPQKLPLAPSGSGLSILNRASTSTPAPPSSTSPTPLSIRNRAAASTSHMFEPSPSASAPHRNGSSTFAEPTMVTNGLSIRKASEVKASPPARPPILSIRSASSGSDGVVRKGRGFQKEQEEQTVTVAFPSLASRITQKSDDSDDLGFRPKELVRPERAQQRRW